MELEDYFNFKDFFRTMLLASALFFIVGTGYGILLHAMFSSEVIGVKQDLHDISLALETKAEQALTARTDLQLAQEWKMASINAEKLSKDVNPPPVTPNAYTYFNYWVASAAFTTLKIDNEILGMDEKSVKAFDRLDTEEALGKTGWWNNPRLKLYSERTDSTRQLLANRPELKTYFWTFYIFVFIIGFGTAFIAIKEEYEIPTLPDIIYGIFMPVPFFIIFAFFSLLAYLEMGFLEKSQVNMIAVLVSFVIMALLCAIAAVLARALKARLPKKA